MRGRKRLASPEYGPLKCRSRSLMKKGNVQRRTSNAQRPIKKRKRVRGIEPPCAAWEAAVLPLNYTRNRIFDFRFSIADCNPNKARAQNRLPLQARQNRSLPGNYVVSV